MPFIDCRGHSHDWTEFAPGREGPSYRDRCRLWAERFDASSLVSGRKPIDLTNVSFEIGGTDAVGRSPS